MFYVGRSDDFEERPVTYRDHENKFSVTIETSQLLFYVIAIKHRFHY